MQKAHLKLRALAISIGKVMGRQGERINRWMVREDVAEPSKCVYEAYVLHPGACEESEMEMLSGGSFEASSPKAELWAPLECEGFSSKSLVWMYALPSI